MVTRRPCDTKSGRLCHLHSLGFPRNLALRRLNNSGGSETVTFPILYFIPSNIMFTL
jgi:hypothetical protein